MLIIRRYLKPFLFILGGILLLTLLMTILSFFNIIGGKIVSVIKLIIPIFSTLIGGLLVGKRSISKGWLSGIKLGLVFILILILFDFLGLGHKFKITDFIYYLILIISSSLGGMIGINLTNQKK